MSVGVVIKKSPWLSGLAKAGLAAKGMVYCLIGLLAFMVAFQLRSANQDNDKQGVFKLVLEQPAGKVLLAAIIFGLLCYSLWRFAQSIFNTSDLDHDIQGYGKRFGYLCSGLTYLFICFIAARLLLGNQQSGGTSRQEMVGELLGRPGGQWFVASVAAILAGMGVYQIFYGFSEKYKKHIDSQKLHKDASLSLLRAGKVGYVSRGIVWLIMAFLFLRAALHNRSAEAGDTSSAFQFVNNGEFGSYLLGALAIGLICYGVMNFIRAAYERF